MVKIEFKIEREREGGPAILNHTSSEFHQNLPHPSVTLVP